MQIQVSIAQTEEPKIQFHLECPHCGATTEDDTENIGGLFFLRINEVVMEASISAIYEDGTILFAENYTAVRGTGRFIRDEQNRMEVSCGGCGKHFFAAIPHFEEEKPDLDAIAK